MQKNRFYVLLIVAGLLLVQHLVNAAELDRGHRVLVERGLQIAAAVHKPANNFWSSKDWTDSGFTAAHPWWGGIETYIPTPGLLWCNRTGHRGEGGSVVGGVPYLQPQELPYLPYLVSWCFGDEQDLNTTNNAAAAAWVSGVRANPLYDNVILYTNQAGNYDSSVENLRTLLQTVQPDMLMFDTYPFGWTSGVGASYSPDNFYSPLSRYRKVGLEGIDGTGQNPIPYGLYLQTYVTIDPYGYNAYEGMPRHNYRPSESEIRFNQFAAWAFGFKYASAFIYDAPSTDPEYPYTTLMFQSAGQYPNRSAEFAYVAATNAMSRKLGPALVRLLSTDIRIKKGITAGQSQIDPSVITPWSTAAGPYITEISDPSRTDGNTTGDVLIGYFKPLDESFDGPLYSNQKYFMIVNAVCKPSDVPGSSAQATAQNLRIKFNFGSSGITGIQRLSRTTGQVENITLVSDGGSLYHYDFTLEGGTGDLFKFNTGAPFVGTYRICGGDIGYLNGDINGDCKVDLLDFTEVALDWTLCNDPQGGSGCVFP